MRGPARLSFAFVVAALIALSASAQQLNPTVKVLPKPQTSVPPECEEGLAPAPPRAIIAENRIDEVKPAAEPPTLDLKTRLRSVLVAAQQGNYDAFKSAFADARTGAAAYPPGGERNAVNDVLNVFGDLERLWDYQLTSPSGAFFDSSTDFPAMMTRYPAYAKSIADQTLKVGAQTVYPTAETRQFLVAEAARRLENLGVHPPARIAEVQPKPTPAPSAQPAPTPQPSPVPRHVPEKPAVRKMAHAKPHPAPRHVKAEQKPAAAPAEHQAAAKTTIPTPPAKKPAPVKIAEAKPAPTTLPAAPMTTPTPAPKTTPPPPAPMTTTVAPAPPPAHLVKPAPIAAASTSTSSRTSALKTTSSTAPPAPATTASSGTASTTATAPPTSIPATQTAATATTGTTSGQNQSESGRPNLLFAIILIVIGVGVLIILFRTAD